jgi:hypothetical protein
MVIPADRGPVASETPAPSPARSEEQGRRMWARLAGNLVRASTWVRRWGRLRHSVVR